MFNDILCPICNKGHLDYDEVGTYAITKEFISIKVNEVKDIVDSIVDDNVIMTCHDCGFSDKYNFYSLGKLLKRTLLNRFITSLSVEEITKNCNSNNFKYLVYCGDCNGFDGNGACPHDVFEDCGIRRLQFGL